jgi:hypothetical protein
MENAVHKRYVRIRKLGQGAMGVVHEVEEQPSHRRFALKTIRGDDPELLYRLKREFRTLAGVRHPNLVRLHELAFDGQEWFFTMDLIAGGNFLSHVRMSDRTSDHVGLRAGFQQLAQGLRALHEAGFVHRDIKPSNVLVEATGKVVIVDFGLASPLSYAESGTLSADAAGTVGYVAPELLQSGALALPDADWYAVGVLLFESLTGRRPFQGSDFEIMQQKTSVDAPAVEAFAPDAPPDLARLCARLLSRDPSVRRLAAQEGFGDDGISRSNSWTRKSSSVHELVGREPELLLLDRELRVAAGGACRVLLLRGESGIGKSTLVRGFLRRSGEADEHLVALAGRCYQRETLPFRALDGLVDQLSSHWKRLPRANAMFLVPREAEWLLRLFPVLGRVSALTELANRSEQQLPPHEALHRSMLAFKETLHRLARGGPLVLWLDDAQWIDQDSARLLSFLMDPKDPVDALFILTSRPLDSSRTSSWPLEPLLASAQVTELVGLSDAAMHQLVSHAAKGEPDEVRAQVVREAAGSPFFALSFGRRLAARSEEQPTGLNELFARDLSALPAAARLLLELASVAGHPLHPRVAARAAELPEAQVEEELDRLEAANLTQLCAGSFVGYFEPYHDRIREPVVARLTAPRREQLNAALARALDAEAEVDHEACARHYRAAGLLHEAARHAGKAAERAVAEFGFGRAAAYYELCLEVPSLTNQERADLHIKLACAFKNAGRGREAAEEYLRGAACADAAGRVECEQRAAEEFLRAGHAERGLETLRNVLAQVGLSYPKSTVRAVASSLLRHGLTRALPLPVAGRTKPKFDEFSLRRIDVCSGVAHSVGFLDPFMTSYYQSLHLRMALETGEPSRVCRALAAEAIYVSLGGKESRHGDRLLTSARQWGQRADDRARGVATYSEGVVGFMFGDWSRALDLCQKGEEILRSSCTGVQWELDTTMLYVLAALCNTGDLRGAHQCAERHLEEAASRADLYALTILRAGSAHVLRLARDEPHLVESDVASVMSTWPARPFSIPRYWELSALTNADLYLGTGERALARFRDWDTQIARSLPMRVQVTRIRMRHARARALLAVAAASRDSGLLNQVDAEAQAIEEEQAAWAMGLSTALRAGVAATEGADALCLQLLELGERQLRNAGMLLDAKVLTYARGAFVGGTGGALLIEEAQRWMTEQGIKNPASFRDAYAPGLRTRG